MKNWKTKRLLCALIAALMLASAPLAAYNEARAAEVVIGGIALAELLESLFVTLGCASVGYTVLKSGEKSKDREDALKRAVMSDASVSAALNEAAEWERSNGGSALKDGYTYVSPSGFRVMGLAGNKGVEVGISADLSQAIKAAVKKWAESRENVVSAPADAEKEGTETVSSPYMSSISTTVKTIPAVDSMADMDSAFGVNGAFSYLESLGYSDKSHYWLVNLSGSRTYFMPIPYGYSVVGYHTAYSAENGVRIISNADYKNAVVQNGMRDSSAFYYYFLSLPVYTGMCHVYDNASSSWSVLDRNYVPGYNFLSGRYVLSGWYTCGYKGAYAAGSLISYNDFSPSLKRILYTFDSVGEFLSYDYSKAPAIPDDGVSFVIPETDYSGFGEKSLSELVPYVTSLSDVLDKMREEQDKNHDETMQQGKDTLEAINNMHDTIGKISLAVSGLLSAMLKILPVLDELMDAAVSLPSEIADGLADVLPDAVADAVADVLPDAIADALDDVVVTVPEVTISEIKIPEIVISEIAAPDVNVALDPSYNITVENDFLGLEDIIASAVSGVLTRCFVPDEVASMDKLGSIRDYFKFKDDIIMLVGDLKEMVFGITPSPILKIPIGKASSKKYNYGFGSYIIVDISWYAQYKQFGDKIILALAWALFLWRMYIKLPGIISGAEGGIVAVDKAHTRYELTKSSRSGR